MTTLQEADVYLVGSMAVPTDTVEEAMQVAVDALGDRLSAMPDGEVGARAWWTGGLGQMIFAEHPDIEQVPEEQRAHAVDGTLGPIFNELGSYRLKSTAGEVSFDGYPPYAAAALESYALFRAHKDAGRLSADVRFQVALPTPFAVVQPFFGDSSQWPVLMVAWQRAVKVEIARILEVIPADELAIQWDYCNEDVEIVGASTGRRESSRFLPWTPTLTAEEALATYTAPEYLEGLTDGIPDAVRFGYHVCMGTFPEFPAAPADDLTWVVRVANALVANTPRRVDFLHLPALADAGREFFAPLAGLQASDARVFLGLGQRDGAEAIRERGRAAREYLPSFGISHYCGYGRDDREHIVELLQSLRAGADLIEQDRQAAR